ncbi:MAG: hypothetical protein ACTS6G_01830, partial [Candidatus Hodgkinia cicadicola]
NQKGPPPALASISFPQRRWRCVTGLASFGLLEGQHFRPAFELSLNRYRTEPRDVPFQLISALIYARSLA